MSEPEDEHPADARDEVLVAYLDGQLPADESEALEARLATDLETRERLQSLDRVWNALEVLPRSTASAEFTRTTVDMAAVAAEKPTKTTGWLRQYASLLACACALIFGALTALAVSTAPERQALADLPASLHADALENAGSIEFLVRLADGGTESLAAFRTEAIRTEATVWANVQQMVTPERRAWVEQLPADEMTDVAARVDRFEDRLPTKQQPLREFAQDLASHERSAELREVALAYQAAVARLTPARQSELRQLGVEKRFAAVQRSGPRWARDVAMELTEAERATVRAAVDRLVASERFKNDVHQIIDGVAPGNTRRWRPNKQALLRITTLVAEDPLNRPKPPGSRLENELARRFADQMRRRLEPAIEKATAAWSGWAEQLESALPADATRVFADAADGAERAQLMRRVLYNALREDQGDAFSELSNEEMQQALLLPADQFAQRLSGGEEQPIDFLGPPPGPGGFGRPGGGPPGFDPRRGPRRGFPPEGRRPLDGPRERGPRDF